MQLLIQKVWAEPGDLGIFPLSKLGQGAGLQVYKHKKQEDVEFKVILSSPVSKNKLTKETNQKTKAKQKHHQVSRSRPGCSLGCSYISVR